MNKPVEGQVWKNRKDGSLWTVRSAGVEGSDVYVGPLGMLNGSRVDWTRFENAHELVMTADGRPIQPPADFRPGDVVLLKSGGMKMVVTDGERNGQVWTTWHSETGEPISGCYPPVCLMHWEQEQGTP